MKIPKFTKFTNSVQRKVKICYTRVHPYPFFSLLCMTTKIILAHMVDFGTCSGYPEQGKAIVKTSKVIIQ